MLQLIRNVVQDAKSELHDRINAFRGRPVKGHGEISKRINHRHSSFWKSPDATIVQNTFMQASDPIEKWKDVANWQRKLSNKYNSREFARKHGCPVPDLYWRGRDIDIINFNNLPDQFVLKPSVGHSSKLVFLMNNKFNLLDNCTYSRKNLTNIMAEALEKNHQLQFLIEEFIRTEQKEYKVPVNYKFLTFNGEIAGINVINRIGVKECFMRAYDENWNLMHDISNDFPKGAYQDPPDCLKEMVAYAKKLSRAYEMYVRIDFYASDKGAIFGEFTPTPSLGKFFTPEANKLFISYWDKYCKGMI